MKVPAAFKEKPWLETNALRTYFWISQVPIAFWLGWIESIPYVVLLSQFALIEGAWSTHRAKMAERESRNNGN